MSPSQILPVGWVWAQLGDFLSAIEAGKSFKCDERPPTGEEVGVVKVSAVTWGTFDEDASKTCIEPERVEKRYFIRKGDFLFSRANTIQLVGACVIVHDVNRRLMLSDKILRFRLDGVLPEWVLYVLRSPWGRAEIERLATGNQESMRNIGQERIRAIRLPRPPLSEQRRIVTAIENHFTRLDAAVSTLEACQRRLNRYRRSVLDVAFAEFSGGETIRLEDLGEVVGGVTKGQKRRPNSVVRSVPYLRVANVQRGHLDLRDIKSIEATEAEIEQFALQPGDVLLNEGGDRDKLGRGWVWKGELPLCIHQNHVFRVRLRPELALPEFLSWYANSVGQQYFYQEGKHTTNLASISLTKLRAFPVPKARLADQKRLVSDLERRLSVTNSLAGALSSNMKRADRLRQAILMRALAGKLVPQDQRGHLTADGGTKLQVSESRLGRSAFGRRRAGRATDTSREGANA